MLQDSGVVHGGAKPQTLRGGRLGAGCKCFRSDKQPPASCNAVTLLDLTLDQSVRWRVDKIQMKRKGGGRKELNSRVSSLLWFFLKDL